MASSSSNSGAAMTMSRRALLMAGSLVCVPSLGRAADRASRWQMWIEQSGGRTEITPDLRLKREPFTLVFQGPRKWAYGVMACEDPADIVGKDPLEVLKTTVNAFKFFAEPVLQAENTYLGVNGTGAIAADINGMHHWSDEPSNDPDVDVHEFTRFTADGKGNARAERDIRTIVMVTTADNNDETPVEKTTIASISLIAVAIKPAGADITVVDYVDPLSFTIIFA